MPGLGLGRAFSAAPSPSIPLSFWNKGYWDSRTLAGIAGDLVPSGYASQIGANSLTASGSPIATFDDTSIAGNRTIDNVYANSNLFRCDVLAPLFTFGTSSIVAMRARSQGSAHPTPLWGAGNSTSAIHNLFQVQIVNGTQLLQIITNSVTNGTITRTGTTNLQFDNHIVIVWTDGTTIFVDIDGNPETLDNNLMDTAALTLDRFAVAGFFTTAAVNFLDGYWQNFACANASWSRANSVILTNQWQSGDFTLQPAAQAQVIPIGDSITETSFNTIYGAGIREPLIQWVVDQALSIRFVGLRQAGTEPNRMNEAQGGANLATILANSQAAAADGTINPVAGVFMGGTNNMADANSTATHLAAWRTCAQGIQTAFQAKQSSFRLITTTIPPVETGTSPADTNVPPFNAGLLVGGGEFDHFDSVNPSNTLIRYDGYAALGSSWSLQYFDSYPVSGTPNTSHPNELGCQQWGLGSSTSMIQKAGLFLRSLSSTLVAASAAIKTPIPSASLPHGTPVTISGRVSRYPSTGIVKLGSTVLGSATMSNLSWSFTWTPGVGDVGAQTINFLATDTLDGSVTLAAPVAVTVT